MAFNTNAVARILNSSNLYFPLIIQILMRFMQLLASLF